MKKAWLLVAAAPAWCQCLPVGGGRILARDMARGWPEFAAVDPETPLAYAPVPGVRRVFGGAELGRLAARYGLAAPADPLCFAVPMAEVGRERMEKAMAAAFPEARISISEFSRYPAPEGELCFPREGLQGGGAAGAPSLWKGYVRYGQGRRFAVWARVRVECPIRQVRAVETLRAGEPVKAGQVRVEEVAGTPFGPARAQSEGEVVGRVPRRPIPAGAIVLAGQLSEAREVARGDMVEVQVAGGAAHLRITGRAESSGDRGQTVRIRNLNSQRTFAARVAGKGTAVVETGGRE
jgi:flagella basal body P-ring formation protein FlgA